jgi:hypothetical protein
MSIDQLKGMGMKRHICILGLLLSLTIFVQASSAALTTMLPESSYADGNWQGYKLFGMEVEEGEFLYGRVEFAVYDTLNLDPGGEEKDWVENLGLTGEGQYLYAYQVFNDSFSDRELSSFSVFTQGGDPLNVDETSIDSAQADASSVQPEGGELTNSDTEVLWTWEPDPAGYGYVYASQYSWYLLFLSESSPVAGSYLVQASEEPGEFPTPDAPEPTTMALFGLGSALVAFKRIKPNRL